MRSTYEIKKNSNCNYFEYKHSRKQRKCNRLPRIRYFRLAYGHRPVISAVRHGYEHHYSNRKSKDANKRVNKLLNQTRQIKNTLTSPNIDCGNGRYSLADLCGMGSPDHNFFSACKDVEAYMTDSMKFSIDAIEGNLTEKQKMMIWRKYGISPKNYLFVQQSVAQVKTQASKLMAKATDEAVQLQREERIAKTNAIIQAAYAQTDSDGNMTQGAANEASLYLSQQVVDGLMSLEEAIDQMASLSAARMINEENEKQAEADEMAAEQRKQEAFDNKVPDSFRK